MVGMELCHSPPPPPPPGALRSPQGTEMETALLQGVHLTSLSRGFRVCNGEDSLGGAGTHLWEWALQDAGRCTHVSCCCCGYSRSN